MREAEALLLPLLDSAYALALRLTGHETDAEELVQESALAACRGFSASAPGTMFKVWFFRILTQRYSGQYRKHQIRPAVEDTPELLLYCQTAAAGLHRGADNPAALLLDRLDPQAVAGAIDTLPEEYRLVATLYFLQEFSYQEMGVILDLPAGTVRARLHRARRGLQRALWKVALDLGIVAGLGAGTGSGGAHG
jgi:RNA polymerase sigma-70 factor (ECF subfamily)